MPKTKDLTKILRPDSKLLPEEHACHKRLGLCGYCGEKHGEKCPTKPLKEAYLDNPSTLSKPSNLSNSSKPKGQVAQVVEDSESDSRDVADSDF